MQKKLMQFLPLTFAVFSFTFAAALGLYFLTSNLYQVAQQWYISRHLYGMRRGKPPRPTATTVVDTTSTESEPSGPSNRSKSGPRQGRRRRRAPAKRLRRRLPTVAAGRPTGAARGKGPPATGAGQRRSGAGGRRANIRRRRVTGEPHRVGSPSPSGPVGADRHPSRGPAVGAGGAGGASRARRRSQSSAGSLRRGDRSPTPIRRPSRGPRGRSGGVDGWSGWRSRPGRWRTPRTGRWIISASTSRWPSSRCSRSPAPVCSAASRVRPGSGPASGPCSPDRRWSVATSAVGGVATSDRRAGRAGTRRVRGPHPSRSAGGRGAVERISEPGERRRPSPMIPPARRSSRVVSLAPVGRSEAGEGRRGRRWRGR